MKQNNSNETLLNTFREIILEYGMQCREMTEKLVDAAVAFKYGLSVDAKDNTSLPDGEQLAKAMSVAIEEMKGYLVSGGEVPRTSMALSWMLFEHILKNGSKLSETTKLQQRINDLEALVNKKDALIAAQVNNNKAPDVFDINQPFVTQEQKFKYWEESKRHIRGNEQRIHELELKNSKLECQEHDDELIVETIVSLRHTISKLTGQKNLIPEGQAIVNVEELIKLVVSYCEDGMHPDDLERDVRAMLNTETGK